MTIFLGKLNPNGERNIRVTIKIYLGYWKLKREAEKRG